MVIAKVSQFYLLYHNPVSIGKYSSATNRCQYRSYLFGGRYKETPYHDHLTNKAYLRTHKYHLSSVIIEFISENRPVRAVFNNMILQGIYSIAIPIFSHEM